MRLFRRFAERRRSRIRSTTHAPYVCTLCGAGYEDRSVVVCPKCRGFVVARKR